MKVELILMKTNTKRNLITFAAVGAIALCGYAFAQPHDGPGGRHGGAGGWHGRGFALDHLTKSLDLTPEQQAKVQPLIDQARPQIAAIHKEAMQKTHAIIENTTTQIRPMLNADQQKKLDAIKKAHEDMRNAMQEMHAAMQE